MSYRFIEVMMQVHIEELLVIQPVVLEADILHYLSQL